MAEILTDCGKGRKKLFCDVCSTFISSESLLVVHNNGKKHQRLLRAREERKESTERSIYVRGFEVTFALESDLSNYFSQFGKVSSIFVDKEKTKFAIVQFECSTDAEKVLSSKQLPLFHGKHLIIKKRTLKEPTRESPKHSSNSRKAKVGACQGKTGCFLDEEIIERIKCSPTLDEQVLAVVSSTCLTEDDSKLRSLIVQYLQEIFVEIFPACVVTPFGSTSTRLGLKGADIDLCLLVDPESLNSVLDKDDAMPCQSDSTEQVLEFVVKVLRQFAAGFQNVVSVTTAKCPVVKFVHRDSGLACDLSVNNRLAIRNTELINYYVGLDDRIRPLAITLKNWGTAKRLTGSGGRQISNYSLVLMLFNFLQRTRPPVIPVLQLSRDSETMMEDTVVTEKMIIDGWDCSFMSTAANISLNKESLGALLKDWFLYYGTVFDYVNEVITIRHNVDQRVLKTSVGESVFHAAAKPNIFKLSPLCVQDPFELSHNLTQNVSVETLRRFIQSCIEAHTSLSNNSDQTMDGCVSNNCAFIELFTLPNDATQNSKKSFYSFTIPYPSAKLNPNKTETFSFTRLQQTCEFLVYVLNNELQIICKLQPDNKTNESIPTEKFPNLDRLESCESMMSEDATCEDNMCVDEDVGINEDFSSTSRKRPHEVQRGNDIGAKRRKSNDENKNATFTLLCKATQITWQNRRRQRRLHTANDDAANGPDVCQGESAEIEEANNLEEKDNTDPGPRESGKRNPQSFLPNIPHTFGITNSCMEVNSPAASNANIVMEFKLTISEHANKGSTSHCHQQCNVVLTHLGGSLQQFANFYAFFKKFVVRKIAECV